MIYIAPTFSSSYKRIKVINYFSRQATAKLELLLFSLSPSFWCSKSRFLFTYFHLLLVPSVAYKNFGRALIYGAVHIIKQIRPPPFICGSSGFDLHILWTTNLQLWKLSINPIISKFASIIKHYNHHRYQVLNNIIIPKLNLGELLE